jgi:dipeptidase
MRVTTAIVVILLLAPAARTGRACTSIVVTPSASTDGSVMTSHTCDSHRTGSAVHVRHRRKHGRGATLQLTRRREHDKGPMKRYTRTPTGRIPQLPLTYGYIAPAYAAMNEHQVAIGESTFEGRKELLSKRGLIDCETLCQLMLERAKTAREAIGVAGQLLERHGWNDVGEALTIVDKREAWLMEIVGPGKGRKGAVWAARRVPDGHVTVVANASRIGVIDTDRSDWYLASKNVTRLAREKGWWDPKSGEPFRFWKAYNPGGRVSFASTRREWRVLSLLAPKLKLSPNANEFPFSIKPERKVSPARIMEIFRDTFEGTDFDVVKNITVTDEKTRKTVKSPLANPFMPYDMNRVLRINGGWGWKGERPLARWYCMYATVTQSRASLPDAVGGVVWLGYDNPAMTTYVPIYAGVTDLPADFKTDGRVTGFSRRAAWWAFNRVATLAAHRWGEMRRDVARVRDRLQRSFFAGRARLERRAATLARAGKVAAARALVTERTRTACRQTVEAYWKLGDHLWTAYDEQW